MLALIFQVALTFGNINYAEIGGIIAAILISTTVSTVSEYRSEKAFEKLNGDSNVNTVSVLRNGALTNILLTDIVVGDIVYINAGEKVPADCVIIDGRVTVDQSALNGESTECVKSSGEHIGWDLTVPNKVFRGSMITGGSAVAKVVRVGSNTYFGMIAKDVQTPTRTSPLKLRLTKLAKQISNIGYIMAVAVGVAYLFNEFFIGNHFDRILMGVYFSDYKTVFTTVIHALTLMITVVVVAAPEGLPMMITVVLSSNMKRMLSDNILVKKLVGIETAGSMNILFTDKTGTITEGCPKCDQIITMSGIYKNLSSLKKNDEIYNYLNLNSKLNTDVVKIGDEIIGGNSTDRAIFMFFDDGNVAKLPRIISKNSFSSEKKMSSVFLDNGISIYKGAPDIILPLSNHFLDCDGLKRKNSDDKDYFYQKYYEASKRGERVLAVAISNNRSMENLTLVALIVMKDRIRKDVRKAVENVISAGIQVVMLTGDGKDTAVAIATESGIMNSNLGHIAIESNELKSITDDKLKEILPRLRVISRALPQDKTRLVRVSQEMNLVCGMTGDGINDAPSLKLADVGFSMGSGTDIAKSASDIVILNNSFSAISKTVLYGRTIFKSIRKFIVFQLVMNMVACGVSLIGQFIGIDTPITIIQMLWVNIIMDTLGGLAFAGESPQLYYMKEKPKHRDEAILTRSMLSRILICGIITLGICILFLTSPVLRSIFESEIQFYTAFYALFIFSGIFNCFAARSERLWLLSNILQNRMFVVIMLIITAIQLVMIYYGGAVFRCTPLTYRQLLITVIMAMWILPLDTIRRIAIKLK